jgi:hypothetical protein
MNDFTVADVLAWARTKPAGQRYDYIDCGACALSRFLLETGRAAHPQVWWGERGEDGCWRDGNGEVRSYPAALEPALEGSGRHDWTYADLVSRLEAIIQEAPAGPSPWINPQTYLNADCGSVSA